MSEKPGFSRLEIALYGGSDADLAVRRIMDLRIPETSRDYQGPMSVARIRGIRRKVLRGECDL